MNSKHGVSSDLKAIIFDFDGTLVDSEPIWKSTIYDFFLEQQGIELSPDMLWANTGAGIDLTVQRHNDALNLGMDTQQCHVMAQNIIEAVHLKILEEVPLRPGVTQVFDWAIANDIALAICTASTSELMHAFFDRHELRHIFSHIETTAFSDFAYRKPFPFPYLQALKALEIEPNQAIAIEDSPAGVTSAVKAGIDTIAITSQFIDLDALEAQPKYQVQDFLQVLELLVS